MREETMKIFEDQTRKLEVGQKAKKDRLIGFIQAALEEQEPR